MTRYPSRSARQGATLLMMAGALVVAAVMRPLTERLRGNVAPGTTAVESTAAAELGQFDSAALALLLGGLRGPLVMALWTSVGNEQSSEDSAGLGNLDTKIELIRLLQPRFDSVHLQQIYNKAYNISAELVSPAARYTAILDGIDYGQRVLEDRPYNLDIETQLSQIYSNKLGGADERDYYARRVRAETSANVPRARVVLPAESEGAFRDAAARAGVASTELDLRPGQSPAERVVVLPLSIAEAVVEDLQHVELSVTPLPPVPVAAVDDPGRPTRLPPMLDEEGNVLAELSEATREPPEGAGKGTFLDGSTIQFLEELGPYPEGIGPQALAYEHAMRAYVLQEYAGQRHTQHSVPFIRALPGRALRGWSLESFEEGRQLEVESMDREPPRRSIDSELLAETEQLSADVPLDGSVPFPALLRRAVQYYERSNAVAGPAADWLERQMELHPESRPTFQANVTRLDLSRALLAADILYGQITLGESDDLARAAELYREADRLALDYVIRYHVDERTLPPGVDRDDAIDLPFEQKQQIYGAMQRLRNEFRNTGLFEAERIVNEFDGLRGRINTRLNALQAAGAN